MPAVALGRRGSSATGWGETPMPKNQKPHTRGTAPVKTPAGVLQCISQHEAGHVIAAHVLEYNLGKVSVTPPDDSAGSRGGKARHSSDHSCLFLRYVGAVGGLEFDPDFTWLAAISDGGCLSELAGQCDERRGPRRQVDRALSYVLCRGVHDAGEIGFTRVPPSEQGTARAEIEKRRRYGGLVAEGIVRDYRNVILSVAQDIQDKLEGGRVWAPPPRAAIDALIDLLVEKRS
jgi:hypothetical protein